MFPIRDHNPSRHTPVVTWALMAANILVFISYWPLFQDERALFAFYLDWGMVPARISAGEGYHSFVTSMFLHGGLGHLGGNMLFLWIFGDNLEDEMGRGRFLGFYLLGGIGAGLGQYLVDPSSGVPVVGASGAIAAVMGGYLLMFPKARVDILVFLVVYVRILPVPAALMLGLWFAFQLLNGAASLGAEGGVAYWAHAGGFLVGVALTLPLWLARGGMAFWNRTHGHPAHPEAQYPVGRSSIPRVGRRRGD